MKNMSDSLKWVGVMPWIYRPYYEECVATMHPDFKKNVLFVDNSVNNLGIMKSHNMGLQKMLDEGADGLLILGASIRFGPPGGLDLIEAIANYPEAHVLHGVSPEPDGLGRKVPYGWHTTFFRRSVLEGVGGWDENFSPYSLCDIDMSIRIRKFFKDPLLEWDSCVWSCVYCDVKDTTSAHGINLAGVRGTYAPRDSYFKRKWGRSGGEWNVPAFDHPFNDPSKPVSYWPAPEDPNSIWKNEYASGKWNYNDVS